jgi:replicative DNA helicase Mcm
MSTNARIDEQMLKDRTCCFDRKTEVLTNNGWKLFKNLNDNDLIYSLNPETNNMEYSNIKKFYEYDYEDKMIKINAQSINQLITPNHKLFVSYSYENKKFILDEAENYKNHKTILLKKNCNPIEGIKINKIIIPEFKGKNKFFEEYEVDLKDFLTFLGMYLSDGFCYKSNGHYNIGIAKGSEEKINKYYEILQRITKNKVSKPKKYGSKWTIIVHDQQLYNIFNKFGKVKDKYIPDFVWQLDHSLLINLFQGLCDGDMNKSSTIYTTISEKLANDIQRLIFHLGFSATITPIDRRGVISEGIDSSDKKYKIISKNICYNISINYTKNEPIIKTTNRDAFSIKLYKGKINCIELEKNNILYIRRNGKTCWSGNSTAQWEIRNLSIEKLKQLRKLSKVLYEKALPPCVYSQCKEGKLTCGKSDQVKEFFNKI